MIPRDKLKNASHIQHALFTTEILLESESKSIFSFWYTSPLEEGYEGPFGFVITKGKKIAITGVKNGKRQIAWFEDPDYEDWTGRFED
ncbi:MAG: hypothetical protein ACKVGW_19555 [Verrucomicrobiia bacterium]